MPDEIPWWRRERAHDAQPVDVRTDATRPVLEAERTPTDAGGSDGTATERMATLAYAAPGVTTSPAPPSSADGRTRRPRGAANPVGVAASIVGIAALLLAVIPVVSFIAWVPAVVALALGIGGLVAQGRRRAGAAAGTVLGGLALLIAVVVSALTVVSWLTPAAVERVQSAPATVEADGRAQSGDDAGTGGAGTDDATDDATGDDLPADEPTGGSTDGSTSGGTSDLDDLAFGETAAFGDGVTISVSAPTLYEPSAFAVGDDRAVDVQFTVTIVNGSSEDVGLFALTQATSGGEPASRIWDGGLESAPFATVLAGEQLSWIEGWSVADPGALVVEASPNGFEYRSALFTNVR